MKVISRRQTRFEQHMKKSEQLSFYQLLNVSDQVTFSNESQENPDFYSIQFKILYSSLKGQFEANKYTYTINLHT